MYTKVVLISALAAVTVAAPAPTNNNRFVGESIHDESVIELSSIQANGQKFYTGSGARTSTYCPEGIEGLNCSETGNYTAFDYNPSGKAVSLDVEAPGGQLVYVEEDGALGFTRAHSASIRAGASLTEFEYTPQSSSGAVGKLEFNKKIFAACPTLTENVYQLYATGASGYNRSDCIDIAFGTAKYTGPAAWEYA